MASHSYLVNLNTNINHLHTAGLLRSKAALDTITNVNHMHGNRHSVIDLSELLAEISFTDAQIAAREALADKIEASSMAKITDSNLPENMKDLLISALDKGDDRIHSFLEAHRAAP